MKVIDLLNKIANNENYRPLQVKWGTVIYYYMEKNANYKNNKNNNFGLFAGYTIEGILNDTVEILEEEKKIPEKLEQILSKRGKYNSIDELAEEVFKAFETIDDLIINQNQLIDYLKSKGDE